jgi:hypothetical protein
VSRGWPLSASLCFGTAFFRYVNAFADWMSLAMIALSRCLYLVWPDVGRRLFTGKRGLIVIVLIWVYSVALLTPFYPVFNGVILQKRQISTRTFLLLISRKLLKHSLK